MSLCSGNVGRMRLLVIGLAFGIGGCDYTNLSLSEDGFAFQKTEEAASAAAGKIAEYLKGMAAGITADEMHSRMITHYRFARLLDESGAWALPALEEISDFLLPGNIDEEKSFALIDQMSQAAQANEYLMEFLTKAQHETFSDYMKKVDQEGDVVLPDVIAYAHVLERLTVAMREDWRVLRACRDLWKVERESAEIGEQMDLFVRAKLASVELIVNKAIKAHESAHVPYDFMKGILPLNIVEAVVSDFAAGNRDNGIAGTYLSFYKPGHANYNENTGEGPSCFSDDGKAILLHMAFPGKWADLYATWNLAFVTTYPYPHMMVKLLIPSVNDYHEQPAEYIYNRVLALYTHIHWGLIRKVDFAAVGKEKEDWPDGNLTQFWGQVNRENAKKYDSEVRHAKFPWLPW